MGLLGIIMLFTVSSVTTNLDANDYDDDEMKAAIEGMDTAEMGGSIGLAIGMTLLRLLFNALGIYGAMMYKVWPVAGSLAVFALEFVFAMITVNIGGMVLFGFFAYPHYFLIQEMRSGVMSRETYEIEKHSCCCV